MIDSVSLFRMQFCCVIKLRIFKSTERVDVRSLPVNCVSVGIYRETQKIICIAFKEEGRGRQKRIYNREIGNVCEV